PRSRWPRRCELQGANAAAAEAPAAAPDRAVGHRPSAACASVVEVPVVRWCPCSPRRQRALTLVYGLSHVIRASKCRASPGTFTCRVRDRQRRALARILHITLARGAARSTGESMPDGR